MRSIHASRTDGSSSMTHAALSSSFSESSAIASCSDEPTNPEIVTPFIYIVLIVLICQTLEFPAIAKINVVLLNTLIKLCTVSTGVLRATVCLFSWHELWPVEAVNSVA